MVSGELILLSPRVVRLTTRRRPPTTCQPPPAACRLPPAACCLPPVARCLPSTTCRLLPTARRLPPAACSLQPDACRLSACRECIRLSYRFIVFLKLGFTLQPTFEANPKDSFGLLLIPFRRVNPKSICRSLNGSSCSGLSTITAAEVTMASVWLTYFGYNLSSTLGSPGWWSIRSFSVGDSAMMA